MLRCGSRSSVSAETPVRTAWLRPSGAFEELTPASARSWHGGHGPPEQQNAARSASAEDDRESASPQKPQKMGASPCVPGFAGNILQMAAERPSD